MRIFLATTNPGKIARLRRLIASLDADIEARTANDMGIIPVPVSEDGKTLYANALLKAEAYVGHVAMPILGNDTGFYVEGEGFVDAPKRLALGEKNEGELSADAVDKLVLQFWKEIAAKYGGSVSAAWVESFVLLHPDGTIRHSESRREIILTDKEFAPPPSGMPIRALYLSKATGKPALLHTEEEESIEMTPITTALKVILGIVD